MSEPSYGDAVTLLRHTLKDWQLKDALEAMAAHIARQEARVAELEHDNNNLRQVIQSRAEIKALNP